MFGQEAHKLLIINGALYILLAAAFQTYMVYTAQRYQTADDAIYQQYMEHLNGEFTRSKYEWMQDEYNTFSPIIDLGQKHSSGEIGNLEYSIRMSDYTIMSMRHTVFRKIVDEDLQYIKKHPGAHLIYDAGYYRLFDIDSK